VTKLGAIQTLFSFVFLALFASCGLVQKVAVNTTSDLLYDASYQLETVDNWDNFKDAVPANLTIVESLHYLEPHNEKLLVSLIKGFTSYAFVVNETLYYDDFLSSKQNSPNLHQALLNYSKAVKYSEKFFAERKISYQELVESLNKGTTTQLLNDHFDSGSIYDREGLFFTAQAIGSLVNLQRTKMDMIAQLPVAKALFDWVCNKDPNINFGACDLFYGAYEAGRPKMLGGNPQKGKEIFLKMIAARPENWLARASYLQYYVVPMSEESEYDIQKKIMDDLVVENESLLIWSPGKSDKNEKGDKINPRLRIYQTVALKRYEIIKRHSKELF